MWDGTGKLSNLLGEVIRSDTSQNEKRLSTTREDRYYVEKPVVQSVRRKYGAESNKNKFVVLLFFNLPE